MAEAREITEVDLGGAVTMPMIGLGTWQLRGKRGYETIRYALEAGYRHVDTATMYRNEWICGWRTGRRAPRTWCASGKS